MGTVVVVVGLNAQDLTPVELQLCYDEYREDPEARTLLGAPGLTIRNNKNFNCNY